MTNKHLQMSGALFGLPKAPKALLLQYTMVGKLNMVAIRRLLWTSSFYLDDIERCMKGTKRLRIIDWPQIPNVQPVLSGTHLTRQ